MTKNVFLEIWTFFKKCMVGILKGPADEIRVTIIFFDPSNMSVGTKIVILRASDNEI